MIDYVQLELEVVLSHLTWALGTDLKSSGNVVCSLLSHLSNHHVYNKNKLIE